MPIIVLHDVKRKNDADNTVNKITFLIDVNLWFCYTFQKLVINE